MAKKLVRGITNVKTINNQDFDTNNVNDLLSDGQYNYIHRKKGKSEEYHNLTDNIKTISSSNTDLMEVTNDNKINNTATLKPKHDIQKEQVLESTRNTITIAHGTNATPETTKVDTNPEKVLEHDNLISDSEYVTVTHQQGKTTSHIQTSKLKEELDDLYANKQDTLTAGNGITIEGNTISSTGGGGTFGFGEFGTKGIDDFYTVKYVVNSAPYTITTFTIEALSGTTEDNFPAGPLKQQLEKFIQPNQSISNGGITIKNDGTSVKYINNNTSSEATQQGTFTFYTLTTPGGDIEA